MSGCYRRAAWAGRAGSGAVFALDPALAPAQQENPVGIFDLQLIVLAVELIPLAVLHVLRSVRLHRQAHRIEHVAGTTQARVPALIERGTVVAGTEQYSIIQRALMMCPSIAEQQFTQEASEFHFWQFPAADVAARHP